MEKNIEKRKPKVFFKILIVLILLIVIAGVLYLVKNNYIRDEIKDKVNLIINNTNVTTILKTDVYINNGVVYISKSDISNFFDDTITYDEKYNQIITCSETKIASMPIGQKQIQINSANVKIKEGVIETEETYYIPISELGDVYNIKTTYVEETGIVFIDSTDREQKIATMKKNTSIKYKPNTFSRTVAKVEKGEIITIANRSDYPVPEGWTRVRTQNGILGYVKLNKMGELNTVRESIEKQAKIEGKVSLVWDFFSIYVDAPSRNEVIKGVNVVSPSFFYANKNGDVTTNIGEKGKEYIEWAHKNNYKVWPMISNSFLNADTTSKVIKDYKLREKLINQIIDNIVTYNLDGINIDFEDMYEEDKTYFSRFLIELEPKLNEIGAVLSVDVTAPDGAANWSMCYDRYTIGKIADYIIFMAYDQYGTSSTQAGTTAGCDWVEVNIEKFLGQEDVSSEKIVLGIPFYTMLWKDNSPSVVNMKSINNVIPNGVDKKWNEDLKQYYAEYSSNGSKYKIWIEDEKSIEAKLNLISKYNLAGAAFWDKDRETTSVWRLISDKLGI